MTMDVQHLMRVTVPGSMVPPRRRDGSTMPTGRQVAPAVHGACGAQTSKLQRRVTDPAYRGAHPPTCTTVCRKPFSSDRRTNSKTGATTKYDRSCRV